VGASHHEFRRRQNDARVAFETRAATSPFRGEALAVRATGRAQPGEEDVQGMGEESSRIHLETHRLLIRPAEADGLPALYEVLASNPWYLELTEGSGGEAGRYDLAAFQRDWQVASVTGREMLGAYLRLGEEAVGLMDLMRANPRDGCPWIGLAAVRRDRQRLGLGREMVEALVEFGRVHLGWRRVKLGVIEGNEAGRGLAEALGFQAVDRVTRRFPAGLREVVVYERALSDGPA
jgi:RimJ/RimL family protein N-acetyltransferase